MTPTAPTTPSEVDDLYTAARRRASRSDVLSRAAASVLPNYILRQVKSELIMLSVRMRTGNAAQAFRGQTGLLVNLGAGDAGLPGWINVDRASAPNVNCICDARKRLPFEQRSVKGIFTEHFVEHLDYGEEVPHFLSECHRVLQTGGVIRIIVPDAERYIRAYVTGGWEPIASVRPLASDRTDIHFSVKYNTRMELINVVFRQWEEHKFAYDLRPSPSFSRRAASATSDSRASESRWPRRSAWTSNGGRRRASTSKA
jgi:predicted SAM-dependent methyltransferase